MPPRTTTLSRLRGAAAIAAFTITVALPGRAEAQQSIRDVLSFLLTNRSIPTEDFVQDAQATAATADTISGFLVAELGALPVGPSSSGFSYRLNRTLGATVRSSDNFGSFFVDRSLTSGAGRASFAVTFQSITFDTIDGRPLRDGTLISVASRLAGESQPFDVETVSLRLRTDTVLVSAGYGVTDRFDIGATLPMVRLSMNGQRVDTYRGRELLQAAASASASGVGDAVFRAKYNLTRTGASGLSIAGETRLPTGSEDNLLGTGEVTVRPRVIGSVERSRFAVHGDLGYTFGGLSDELDFGGAVTVVGTPRLTLVGEIAARRLESIGRLSETTQAHPTLAGVQTVRLTSVNETTQRSVAVFGAKWNVAGTGILSGHIVRSLTDAGLTAKWIVALTFDYSFEY